MIKTGLITKKYLIQLELLPLATVKEIAKLALVSTKFNRIVDSNKYIGASQQKSSHLVLII